MYELHPGIPQELFSRYIAIRKKWREELSRARHRKCEFLSKRIQTHRNLPTLKDKSTNVPQYDESRCCHEIFVINSGPPTICRTHPKWPTTVVSTFLHCLQIIFCLSSPIIVSGLRYFYRTFVNVLARKCEEYISLDSFPRRWIPQSTHLMV